MKTVLSIAGSDCSGGAGIQADIKTITAHKMYAMTAITALTAQNTTGVYGIMDVDEEFLRNQLDCIFQDIYPDAIKIGMVSQASLIRIIAKILSEYQAKNIVVDPVMISTSGSKLLNDNASEALFNELMPMADIITPNLLEAECLSNIFIQSKQDMIAAAKIIGTHYSGNILIKGGHLADTADDLLYQDGEMEWFCHEIVNNPNTHGTGCTLSSAIACNLAAGFDIKTSVHNAKAYITGALKDGLDLGKGSGPLNHMYRLSN